MRDVRDGEMSEGIGPERRDHPISIEIGPDELHHNLRAGHGQLAGDFVRVSREIQPRLAMTCRNVEVNKLGSCSAIGARPDTL